jgi:hypothetical protein
MFHNPLSSCLTDLMSGVWWYISCVVFILCESWSHNLKVTVLRTQYRPESGPGDSTMHKKHSSNFIPCTIYQLLARTICCYYYIIIIIIIAVYVANTGWEMYITFYSINYQTKGNLRDLTEDRIILKLGFQLNRMAAYGLDSGGYGQSSSELLRKGFKKGT